MKVNVHIFSDVFGNNCCCYENCRFMRNDSRREEHLYDNVIEEALLVDRGNSGGF